MKKSFLVVGLGRFGMGIVETLSSLKADVMAIDVDETRVIKAGEFIEHCFICDSTKESNLKELGVKNIDHAIIAIGGNMQSTILTTIILKEMGIEKITVRVDDDYFTPVMYKIGATDIVLPAKAAAVSLANQIVSDSIVDYYKILQDFGLVKIKVSEDFEKVTLIDMDLRNKFDINVVGIMRNEKFFIPRGSDFIMPEDTILVIGEHSKIMKFDHYVSGVKNKSKDHKKGQ